MIKYLLLWPWPSLGPVEKKEGFISLCSCIRLENKYPIRFHFLIDWPANCPLICLLIFNCLRLANCALHKHLYFRLRCLFSPFKNKIIQSYVGYSNRFPRTKTLKRCKYDPLRSVRHARSIWCMTSSYSRTFVFVRSYVNKKTAFSKIHSGERFGKDPFSVTVFIGYVWTMGHTGLKKISVFKPKRINVDGAWSSPVHQVPFPVYPFLHWQENEPLLFVQIPCWWQLWTLLVHSSTSVKIQSKVQTLFIGLSA